MAPKYYPPINSDTLQPLTIVKEAMRSDGSYLTSVTCPYSSEVRERLMKLFDGGAVSSRVVGAEDLDMDLEVETALVYQDLRDFRGNLNGGDKSETMSYFRTVTALMEKMLGQKERAQTLRQQNDFKRVVMSVLEDLLSPDDREEFTKRLKEYDL